MFSKFKSPFGKGKPVAKPSVKTNTSAQKIAARQAAVESSIPPTGGGKK